MAGLALHLIHSNRGGGGSYVYFINILNIESVFSDSKAESVRERQVREEMVESPSMEEL